MRSAVPCLAVAFCLALSSPMSATTQDDAEAETNAFESCSSNLRGLVAYLEETAQLEGRSITTEWRPDGSVVLHYEGFAQHMWRDGGVMHIDCR